MQCNSLIDIFLKLYKRMKEGIEKEPGAKGTLKVMQGLML